jgi:hypothetical protein
MNPEHRLFASAPVIPTHLKFTKEILMSRNAVFCNVLLVLACGASLVAPAPAQHFKQVKGTLTSVAAGRNEVFGVDAEDNVWRYSAGSKSFSKIAKVSLTQVAVGGGSLSQNDEVWGINASSIYRFNYSKKEFVQVPGILTQISVGIGNQDNCHPYEVWGINAGEEVFRFNYCESAFVQVSGSLTQVATGGGDVWGLNNAGQIFHFNLAAESWQQISGALGTISVGVNDVWGINGSSQLYRYDAKTGVFNLVAAPVEEVAAGGDGVWAINTSNAIFRFDPSREEFVQVTGELKGITAGSGAGVFGVNTGDQVFTFVRP